MKRAVILARVSTKRQEREGLSLDEIQLPLLKDYAAVNDLLVQSEADVFRFSETADGRIRKKFDEMITYVKKNKVQAIVAYRVDRITRNFRDQVLIDTLINEVGIEVHCVQDRLVLTKDTIGRDIVDWDTKVFLAKQFLNRLKEDGHRTKQTKWERGELPGKAPYGYKNHRLSARETTVNKVDFAAGIVRKMYELMATQAYSLDSMREKLRDDYGINMGRSQAASILHNQFYIGYMVDRKTGKRYQHKYETIVSEELFEQVQNIISGRNRNSPKHRGKEVTYRGLPFKCPDCGCSITHEIHEKTQKNGNHHKWTYYKCTQRRGKHGAKAIEERNLTDEFAKIFEGLKIPKDELKRMADVLKQQNASKSRFVESERQNHEAALKRLRNRISKAFEHMLDDGDTSITQEEYLQFKKKWEADIAFHQRKLQTIDTAENSYYVNAIYLLEICSNAATLFKYAEPAEKRELIGMICQNLFWDGKNFTFNLLKPFDTIYHHTSSSLWQGRAESNCNLRFWRPSY